MKKHLLVLALILAAPLAHAYERIISASGNISEIVALLGDADKLVAVDSSSLLPKDVMEKKPKVGYRRVLSGEGILSYTPDLVILPPDAGPAEIIKHLEGAGVPLLRIKDGRSEQGVADDIRTIAKALGREQEGEALIARLTATMDEARAAQQTYPARPRILVLFDGLSDQLSSMGPKSGGDALVQLLGGDNAVDVAGMKLLSPEALLTLPADAILIARLDRHFDDNASYADPAEYPDLAQSQAGKRGCLIQINVMESLGFGPSYADAVRDISKSLASCLNKP